MLRICRRVNDREHHKPKEETVTRTEKSRAVGGWMQAVRSSDSNVEVEMSYPG
jgi:hypothetical protein